MQINIPTGGLNFFFQLITLFCGLMNQIFEAVGIEIHIGQRREGRLNSKNINISIRDTNFSSLHGNLG